MKTIKALTQRLLRQGRRPNPIRDARLDAMPHGIQEVRSYYEKMTPAYLEGFGEVFQGSRPESTNALLDYIVEAAAIENGMHILDAGCGVGGPAIAIAQRRQVTIEGLTIASAQVLEAKRLVAENDLLKRIAVKQGDFHVLDNIYPTNSFDRVLFLEALCHAQSYRKVLTAAHRILKTGGALYIKDFHCVDNRARPTMAAGQTVDLEKLNRLYCLQMPDLASMVDLLSGLGFMIRFMRMPAYEPSYTHWAKYEHVAGRAWNPGSAEPGDIIQAVEFLCVKR